jgi:hypothetical protein
MKFCIIIIAIIKQPKAHERHASQIFPAGAVPPDPLFYPYRIVEIIVICHRPSFIKFDCHGCHNVSEQFSPTQFSPTTNATAIVQRKSSSTARASVGELTFCSGGTVQSVSIHGSVFSGKKLLVAIAGAIRGCFFVVAVVDCCRRLLVARTACDRTSFPVGFRNQRAKFQIASFWVDLTIACGSSSLDGGSRSLDGEEHTSPQAVQIAVFVPVLVCMATSSERPVQQSAQVV